MSTGQLILPPGFVRPTIKPGTVIRLSDWVLPSFRQRKGLVLREADGYYTVVLFGRPAEYYHFTCDELATARTDTDDPVASPAAPGATNPD